MRGQKGISYWGVVMMLFIAFVGIQFFMAAGSAYYDDFAINRIVIERLKSAPNDMAADTLMNSFNQQFDMNGLRTIKAQERLKVTYDGGIEVVKDYEVRNKFIGNMDIIVHFKKTFNQKAIKAAG